MTFEEPPRPRSTPLPGPGAAGSPPPPPPGAPSGPPPPPTGGIPPPPPGFGGQPTTQMPSMPPTPPGPPTTQIPTVPVVPGPGEPKRGISPIWIVAIVAAVLLIGGGIVVALRSGDDSKDADVESTATNTTAARTRPDTSTIPDITVANSIPKITLPPGVTLPGGVTLPDITIPDITIPDITIPDFTIPDFTLPPGVTLPPGITLPKITLPPGVTLPPGITLPNITLPTGGNGLPDGATSIFDQAATGTVVGDLEVYLPGDPSQLTEVVLYPTYAIASAQDPADPENVVGALWRNGSVGSGPPLSPFEIEGRQFTRADVNWDAVSTLVAQAPTLLGDPSDEVTHVIVQRWDFDPALPVRILVYAGNGYVEAAADGTVVTTH